MGSPVVLVRLISVGGGAMAVNGGPTTTLGRAAKTAGPVVTGNAGAVRARVAVVGVPVATAALTAAKI